MNRYTYTVLVYGLLVSGWLNAESISAAEAAVRYAHPMADSVTVEEHA